MTTGTSPHRITVGVDGSIDSHAALLWAVDQALPGDTLHLVHAWMPSPVIVGFNDGRDIDHAARRLVDRELARARHLVSDRNVDVTGEVLHGKPGGRLAEAPTDLLVVGSRRHNLLVGALEGSVCRYLVRHASVPVVIVPDRRRTSQRTVCASERVSDQPGSN